MTVDVNASIEPEDSLNSKRPIPPSPALARPTTVDQSPQLITPEVIRPYPKAPPRKMTNRRRLGKSRIVTDTPVKLELEQQRLSSKRKGHEATKPQSQARRKVFVCDGGSMVDSRSTKVAVTSSSSTRGKKKCSRPTLKKSSECDAACLYCGDFWSTSTEAFVQCQGTCNEWAHLSCAGVGKKQKTFTCERC